jgi:hypothetical protein
LVEHTSHWSQPLDNLLFATLKKNDVRINRRKEVQTSILPRDFGFDYRHCSSIIEEGFTSHVIEASFEGVGLYPFSPSRMKQLALENYVKCGGISEEFQPTEEHEYLVEMVVKGVQEVFEQERKKGQES